MRFTGLALVFFTITLAVTSCTTKVPSNTDYENEPFIDVYFNDPGVNRQTDEDPDIDNKVARVIDNAEKKVYFAFYGFYRKPIKEAIFRAVRRGLDVRFAGDYDHYASNDTGYVEYEELMKTHPNAKMSVGNSQSIMHNKWMVVDGLYVFTGTGNITDSEMDNNNNAWVIIRNEDLAADFEREHAQMMAGRFGHAKVRTDYENYFDVGGVTIENYFSPQEEAMSRFQQAVAEAKYNVQFMIFAFTHDGLGRTILSKNREFLQKYSGDTTMFSSGDGTIPSGQSYSVLQNSIDDNGTPYGVRGVMDRSQLVHAQYVEVYRFASHCADDELYMTTFAEGGTNINDSTQTGCSYPVDFRLDGNENTSYPGDWQGGGGRLHSKVILIDVGTPDAKVLMGSFNWSPNANENNDENLMVIHSREIADKFIEKFNSIYAEANVLPGRKANYKDIVISELNWAGSRRGICFDDTTDANTGFLDASGDTSVNAIDYDEACTNKYYFDYDGNEFVELYNPNDEAIDISYWTLYFPVMDTYNDPGIYISGFPNYEAVQKKAVFGLPGGTVIPAKGFYLVMEPDLRNEDQNAYTVDPNDLYIPETSSTHNNKVGVYNPYNEMSNFISLYDRRSSRTYVVYADDSSGTFTIWYSDPFYGGTPVTDSDQVWAEFCSPAWSYNTDRFSSAQSWDTNRINADSSFPYQVGLEVQLRDSGGNLIDIAGTGRSDDYPNRGGYFTTSTPTTTALFNTTLLDYEQGGCGSNNGSYYMISMERKEGFLDGNDWTAWENASSSPTLTSEGVYDYIESDFSKTIATPGKPNSRWTAAEP